MPPKPGHGKPGQGDMPGSMQDMQAMQGMQGMMPFGMPPMFPPMYSQMDSKTQEELKGKGMWMPPFPMFNPSDKSKSEQFGMMMYGMPPPGMNMQGWNQMPPGHQQPHGQGQGGHQGGHHQGHQGHQGPS